MSQKTGDILTDTHCDHTLRITREPSDRIGFSWEIILYVDDCRVMTASDLESRGALSPEQGGSPWVRQLERYAHGYIDGMIAIS